MKINKFMQIVAIVGIASLVLSVISFFFFDFGRIARYVKHENIDNIHMNIDRNGIHFNSNYSDFDDAIDDAIDDYAYSLEDKIKREVYDSADRFAERIEDFGFDIADFVLEKTDNFLDEILTFNKNDIVKMQDDEILIHHKIYKPSDAEKIEIISKNSEVQILHSKNENLEILAFSDDDDYNTVSANSRLVENNLRCFINAKNSDAKLYILIPKNFKNEINVTGTMQTDIIAMSINKFIINIESGDCLIRYIDNKLIDLNIRDYGEVDLLANKKLYDKAKFSMNASEINIHKASGNVQRYTSINTNENKKAANQVKINNPNGTIDLQLI